MNGEERGHLLSIARAAITAHVTRRSRPPVDGRIALSAGGGVFVSLHLAGTLRGCIGTLDADASLARLVATTAVAACSADPRFEAVSARELPALEIEISLLGPFEPVADVRLIEVGRHGLAVEQGRRRGLLLPQVATHWQWTREEFLAQTCRKAGLREDAWRRSALIWRFEAEVFSEVAPIG
jgi:AmmeMemoRadiSam system protein A